MDNRPGTAADVFCFLIGLKVHPGRDEVPSVLRVFPILEPSRVAWAEDEVALD
jgi:hypothetical protein